MPSLAEPGSSGRSAGALFGQPSHPEVGSEQTARRRTETPEAAAGFERFLTQRVLLWAVIVLSVLLVIVLLVAVIIPAVTGAAPDPTGGRVLEFARSTGTAANFG